jgi:hypothetical protein
LPGERRNLAGAIWWSLVDALRWTGLSRAALTRDSGGKQQNEGHSLTDLIIVPPNTLFNSHA